MTVRLIDRVLVVFTSRTRTTNVHVPVDQGVPLIFPYALRLRPDGSEPCASDQLTVPCASPAASVAEYAT